MSMLPEMPKDTPEEVARSVELFEHYYAVDFKTDEGDVVDMLDVHAWRLARQYLRERAAKIEQGKCRKGCPRP